MEPGSLKKVSESRTMSFLRHLPISLVLLLVASFSCSCSGEEPVDAIVTDAPENLSSGTGDEEPGFGGIFTFLARKDPQTLNNVIRTGGRSRLICNLVFPPLLDYDMRDGRLRPLTAASLPERSADGLVFTWRLRKGIKWHDFEESGATLTTKDVKFSFDLMRDERVDAQVLGDLEGLEEIRVIDDLTFQTIYKKAYFNSFYTFGRKMRIMAAHIFEKVAPGEFNCHPCGRSPVGYGLFRFHHWDTGREILITRCDLNREAFPEAVRPWLDGIRWKVVSDPSMEFLLFEKGEIDIFNMSHDDLFFRTKDEKFNRIAAKHTYYIPWYSYIGWNSRTIFFRDKRVRQAMAHTIRRAQILETHLYGRGKVLSGPFFYFAEEYDRTIEPFPFDLEKARTLLAEAGWGDSDGNGILDREVEGELREFRFEFLTSNSPLPDMNALLRSMIEDLKSLGIVMELRTLEWGARINLIKNRGFDAYDLGSSTDPLYEDYYGIWHSSQIANKGGNRVGYANPRVDEILEAARTEIDDDKRHTLMHELHGILHVDQPVTPLYSKAVNAVVNRRWRNVRVYDQFGINPFEWWLPRGNRTPFDTIPDLQDR
jgi:peptide/nickel transport system substrate-binding protein